MANDGSAARKLTIVDNEDSKLSDDDKGPIDKDGDDGGGSDILEVHISIVENGYFVSFMDPVGGLYSFVFNDYKGVNDCIKKELGVKD